MGILQIHAVEPGKPPTVSEQHIMRLIWGGFRQFDPTIIQVSKDVITIGDICSVVGQRNLCVIAKPHDGLVGCTSSYGKRATTMRMFVTPEVGGFDKRQLGKVRSNDRDVARSSRVTTESRTGPAGWRPRSRTSRALSLM